jgi:predicted MFS family arabinose efflux permease
MPPTYSLVGDYFPQPAARTRAMSVYMLASPLASLVSFALGGRLNEAYGWRVTFFLMAIPALLVAIILKTTVREPRTQRVVMSTPTDNSPRMIDILSNLFRQHSSRHLCIAIILLFTMGFGLGPWYAAFMIRSHGMGTASLGLWLGLIFGAGGMTGILFGGYVTARWFARDEGGQMRVSALMIAAMVPCFALFLLAPGKGAALLGLAAVVLVSNFFFAPTFALLQRLVVEETRATTLALVMLLANLFGMGVGPQVVGVLSDRLAPLLGADSLRYAMLLMSCVALWGAYHFWQAGKSVATDLSNVGTLAVADAKIA